MTDMHVVFGAGPSAGRWSTRWSRAALSSASSAAPRSPACPAGVEHAAATQPTRPFAKAAAKDAATVYQCLNPPYSPLDGPVPAAPSLRRRPAQAAGARYVSFENVYMVGDTHGAPITENLPSRPIPARAASAPPWPRTWRGSRRPATFASRRRGPPTISGPARQASRRSASG